MIITWIVSEEIYDQTQKVSVIFEMVFKMRESAKLRVLSIKLSFGEILRST